MADSLVTPVLLIAFNKPDTTKKVFDKIRKAKPQKLFIAIDGPRNDVEKEKVEEVKKIVSKIDWECDVQKLFRDKNRGLKEGYAEILDWFFENAEEGIILEDDCVPNPSFFMFCQELLEKYRYDDRIMHIAGSNCQRGWKRDKDYSYYFSRVPYTWGWATWRRAWKTYDLNLKSYPELLRKKYINDLYPSFFERQVLKSNFNSIYYQGLKVWDVQWVFNLVVNNGLAIIPNENLIQNIGMVEGASDMTHLDKERSLPTEELKFPLNHPPFMICDLKSDNRLFKWSFKQKIRNTLLRRLGIMKFFKF